MYDIFKPARLASLDEPRHAPGQALGASQCGIPAEESPLLYKGVPENKPDWDGRARITCIDCDPEYTGNYRRGDRNGALPKVAAQ